MSAVNKRVWTGVVAHVGEVDAQPEEARSVEIEVKLLGGEGRRTGGRRRPPAGNQVLNRRSAQMRLCQPQRDSSARRSWTDEQLTRAS